MNTYRGKSASPLREMLFRESRTKDRAIRVSVNLNAEKKGYGSKVIVEVVASLEK